MLSLGDSNSPFSSTDAEAEACSTATFVLIMLTTAPFGLSLAIGCWRLSTSCTVPRMLAAQPDISSRAVRASSALEFMISPVNRQQVSRPQKSAHSCPAPSFERLVYAPDARGIERLERICGKCPNFFTAAAENSTPLCSCGERAKEGAKLTTQTNY